jgi:hypothetical protein
MLVSLLPTSRKRRTPHRRGGEKDATSEGGREGRHTEGRREDTMAEGMKRRSLGHEDHPRRICCWVPLWEAAARGRREGGRPGGGGRRVI